jgi:hypothetical protein
LLVLPLTPATRVMRIVRPNQLANELEDSPEAYNFSVHGILAAALRRTRICT